MHCSVPEGNLLFNRAARRPPGRVKNDHVFAQHASIQGRQNDYGEQKIGAKKYPNTPRNAQNGPQRPQDGSKKAQGHPKTAPRRSPEGQKNKPKPQKEKGTEPRRPQDRLRPTQGPKCPTFPHLQGPIWAPKMCPKGSRKRSKHEAKKQEAKKAIQDDLGVVLARSWGDLLLYKVFLKGL